MNDYASREDVVMKALFVLVCVLFASSVWAQQGAQQDYPTARVGGQNQTMQNRAQHDFAPEPYYVATPDQLIRQAVDRLIGFMMGSPSAEPQNVREFVGLEIAPYFDFEYMSRWAAGRYYHRLTPQQRSALTVKLSCMFLDALSRNLGALQRPLPRVDVFPARPGRSMTEATVYVRIQAVQRPAARLEFQFYWSPQGWKVYDVASNGASAVAYYRRYFTSMLGQHGPDVILR